VLGPLRLLCETPCYCALLVCVANVLGGLAVWLLHRKTIKQQQTVPASLIGCTSLTSPVIKLGIRHPRKKGNKELGLCQGYPRNKYRIVSHVIAPFAHSATVPPKRLQTGNRKSLLTTVHKDSPLSCCGCTSTHESLFFLAFLDGEDPT